MHWMHVRRYCYSDHDMSVSAVVKYAVGSKISRYKCCVQENLESS